jgi:RecA/RadA recombinase
MPVKKKTSKEKPEKKVKKTSKVEKISKEDKKSKKVLEYKTSEMDEMLDSLEKSNGLISSFTENSRRVPTTMAAVDLILNGGLVSGMWYTFSGGEQSSKTTLATMMLASLSMGDYKDKIKIKQFYNYEGSFSSDYFINQARTLGFKGKSTDIFGIQDPKSGEYVQRPIIRKYDEQIAEKFFNMLVSIQRRLPDKIYSREKWWLVYDDTKENKKYRASCDEKQYKRTGKYWIETDNPYPQAVIVTDSLPAMLPEKQDEDDANDPIASQARMFSTQLKRVKGRMQSKKIIVLAINQMRKVPMAMFGPTEEEACGQAVRFYSDARLKMTSRSSVFGTKGKLEKEPSVQFDGKMDYYRYINIKTIKNKTSVPDLETWVRIWIRDGAGKARGYDPVFDSWYFLTQIGACNGGNETSKKSKVSMKLEMIGVKDWPSKAKQIDWLSFKLLISGTKEQQEKIYKEIGYKGKYFSLRNKILTASNDPKYFDLFIEQESKKDKPDKDE